MRSNVLVTRPTINCVRTFSNATQLPVWVAEMLKKNPPISQNTSAPEGIRERSKGFYARFCYKSADWSI